MWYAFENLDTGEVEEKLYRSSVPPVGAIVEGPYGERLQRLDADGEAPRLPVTKVLSSGRRDTDRRGVSGNGVIVKDRGRFDGNNVYKPMQVPPNHPDAPHTDAEGRVYFTSQKELDEFKAKTGATDDGRTIEHGTTPVGSRAKMRKKYGLPEKTARFEKRKT